MYRIAICDDDSLMCNYLDQMLMEHARKVLLPVKRDIFSTGKALYERIREGVRYDFIFLDIEMKELNGVDLGALIRNELNDRLVSIVYITFHKRYFIESFHTRPHFYILKPISRERFLEVLQMLLEERAENAMDYFAYQFKKEIFQVIKKEIVYICTKKGALHMKTVEEDRYFYGTIKETCRKLNDINFFLSGRGCIVNYQYVMKVTPHAIHLETGDIIPIQGRSYKQIIKMLWMKESTCALRG